MLFLVQSHVVVVVNNEHVYVPKRKKEKLYDLCLDLEVIQYCKVIHISQFNVYNWESLLNIFFDGTINSYYFSI